MEGMSPETLAWLAKHPSWDPRVRFAEPSQREYVAASIRSRASQPYAGEMQERLKTQMLGDDPLDGLVGRTSQVNGNCMAADGLSLDMATMRLYMSMSEAALPMTRRRTKARRTNQRKKSLRKKKARRTNPRREPKKDEPRKKSLRRTSLRRKRRKKSRCWMACLNRLWGRCWLTWLLTKLDTRLACVTISKPVVFMS